MTELIRRAFVVGIWFHELQSSRLTKWGDCREVMRVVLSFTVWCEGETDPEWARITQQRMVDVVNQPERHLGHDGTLIPDLYDCLMESLQIKTREVQIEQNDRAGILA
jgi:hypothetical protein